jgi:sulfite reductase (ferredoxin)
VEILDLRNIPCPTNTSKALIFLSTIDTGETIELWLDNGEPIMNVPSSLKIEGHKVIENIQHKEGHWILKVVAA